MIVEIKSNESTALRQEGDRLLDAPLVSMDIPQLINLLKAEATWQNSDRNAMTVYKTNGMRIVLIALHEEADLKEHTAVGIISKQVPEEEINFSTDKETLVLK